ncbi:MAG TPA: dihydrolipoamide acetyltransferase family protein [Burkholderiaceae bacterium]|nr:dihydrolipoamide acetyltransferase family protein [Burkholderiaceae bacterium]
MIPFELPSLGADMEDGTLLEWLIKPGDTVHRAQVVAIVDTSKAAVEVEIWQDGVVEALLVMPGEKVPVGTVLATLRELSQAPAPEAKATPQGPTAARAEVPGVSGQPAVPTPAAQPAGSDEPAQPAEPAETAQPALPAPAPALPPATTSSATPAARPTASALAQARHPVSPAARKRAHELDVDPERIAGTGPHGSVTVADVETAARCRSTEATRRPVPVPAPASDAATAAGPHPLPPAAALARERQKAMRKAIAAAMTRSKREIPHYYLAEQIPMGVALDWLQQVNAGRPIAERILPAALLLKMVALSLRRTPELNGLYRDGEFIPSEAVHAGVAISLRGGGLVAPALHDVATKPLGRLMSELSDLVRRARAGSLRSSEMTDPTLTVTNLGEQGVASVHGVIYPPQVALVGFGRIAQTAWAQNGWLCALPVVTASLAADHRVSDGHRGALFLAELRDRLQQPQALAESLGGAENPQSPQSPA